MRVLERALTAIIATLFVLMIVLVSIQVLNRYGTRASIPWTEELTRTSYVLLIFIGSALAVVQCNHVRVVSAVQLLPPQWRRRLLGFGSVLSAVFFGFVAYGNFVYARVNLDSVFPTMSWLTIGHVIAVVFVSSVMTAVLFLIRAVRPCDEASNGVAEE